MHFIPEGGRIGGCDVVVSMIDDASLIKQCCNRNKSRALPHGDGIQRYILTSQGQTSVRYSEWLIHRCTFGVYGKQLKGSIYIVVLVRD